MNRESKLSPTIKDYGQLAAWTVAILVSVIGVYKGLGQAKADLNFQQAKLSREILEKILDNKKAKTAVQMLDYSLRKYEDAPDKGKELSRGEVVAALDTSGRQYNETEVFIRDSFDELFDGFEVLEHYTQKKLIQFEDVQNPLAYYVSKLREQDCAVFEKYLTHYEFKLALKFIERFPEMTNLKKSSAWTTNPLPRMMR